jgi:hypothetical protein
MKFSKLILFSIFFGVLPSQNLEAANKVSICDKSPEYLNLQRATPSLKNFESLPKLIFVGHTAEHFVQLKSGKLKMWSQHSFKQGKSWVHCADVGEDSDFSSALYGPTLIDQTLGQTVGNSFWQFHLTSKNKQLGVWNRKSRLGGVGQSIDEFLQKLGIQAQVFQVTHDEFDLVLTKETALATEILVIRYDSVVSLN